MPFLKGGRHLWTNFSQSFSNKNEEFLCSLERKLPEFCKTHPTFVSSPLLVPSTACQSQKCVFLGHPVERQNHGELYFQFDWPFQINLP